MVKFIHKQTGTVMWVAEARVDEYKAAGHIPAAEEKPAVKPAEKPAEKKKPVRTTKK